MQVPADHDPSEVTARRILNWIYAWQRLPEAAIGEELVESLREQAIHVREHLTAERNHRTLELYALLLTSLALPDLVPGLQELAVEQLHENLLTDFGVDGVHRERSTHYHMIALRSFAGARENCRRFGVALPASFDERLSRACDFALAHAPPRRHDPGALGQRHRRLLGAAGAGRAAAGARGPPPPARRGARASTTAATSSSARASTS